MKKTCFSALKRMTGLLLAVLMLLSLIPGFVLPAAAASSDKVLPEMSKFFETTYTQAKMTEYSRLLTCTYDKDEGTAPLDAFLELLQEDRYQLVLDSVSDEYPDSYSTATVKDYFFHYTGTSSAIKWIKLKNGTKYHVRVSLYTYEEKDYSAIVYYSHPNFLHRDAGICYSDIQKQETVTKPTAAPEKKPVETKPAEVPKETVAFPADIRPDLSEFFGNPTQVSRKEGRAECYFELSGYPAAGMRSFEEYLTSVGAEESFYEAYETGNILQEYCTEDGIAVFMYWYDSGNSLQVILYDGAWEQIPETEKSAEPQVLIVTALKNRQTVKVQEDAAFRIEKWDKITLKCTYDEGRRDDYDWQIISGKDIISLTEKNKKCKIKGKGVGTAEVEMTYTCENEDGETVSITSVYTIMVE